jgi:hypothetical protein
VRDANDPVLVAARTLNDAIRGHAAVPNAAPFGQLIWATFIRSKRTYEAIVHLLSHEFDTQAAMLCRPLFEDMLVGHWLELNRDDPCWLVERFFRHRDAMALDQLALERAFGLNVGPPLAPDTHELRAQQNALGQEFKAHARRDWWDLGNEGRGVGRPIGVEGIAGLLEDAAAQHQRFDPRFAGGERPMLRQLEAVILRWFSRQLHHTALGLPFQPRHDGPIEPRNDGAGPIRILFTAYWTFGQQGYLLLEHLEQDTRDYEKTFLEGLVVIGYEMAPNAIQESPLQPYRRPS